MAKKKDKTEKHEITPFDSDFQGFFMDPFKSFEKTSSMMQRFFNEGLGVPRVDVEDKGDSYVVTADLPDIDKKDIKVNITNDTISISAKKYNQSEKNEHNFYVKERASSGYYRVIKLQDDVLENTAKASYQNGTLRIEAKKASPKEKHTVRVN